MMDRNGIRKTKKREKRRLRMGSKNKRIYNPEREYKGFYNGSTQTGKQKWEQSRVKYEKERE